MKNKYQRMNVLEKKKCRVSYYQTAKGKEMKARFIRLNILGIVGLLFSIFLVVSSYYEKSLNWATWCMAILLTIFSLVFILGAFYIRGKVLNQYAIKNDK